MATREKKFESQLTSEISNFIERRRKDGVDGESGDVEFLNAIDFIEKFKLLPHGLFPIQRFIVKLYYNIPLDDTEKSIRISTKPPIEQHGNTVIDFTELEYLHYLHDNGRCNIKEQDSKERKELILVLGRRSGKSELSAIFASYEIYKLLRRGFPQNYYGMPQGGEIRILCVANDKEQASIVYGSMQGHIEGVDYFKTNIANFNQTLIRFKTENDKKRMVDSSKKGSITATFKSSIAKGLRGRGIICAILDEIAFFVDDGKCSKISTSILTDSGLTSLDRIMTDNDVDRSKTGWTGINPIEIVQEDGRRAMATRVYYGGIQKTRIITTKSHYTIEPTPEHRLKVMSYDGNIEWKYVQDIRVGDSIGLNRETKLWPEKEYNCLKFVPEHDKDGRFGCSIPIQIDTSLGEFLGILVGDGTWNSGKNISVVQVTGGCEQFLPFVQEHFAKHFLKFGTYRKKPHKNNTCEVSPWKVSKQSSTFRLFLDYIGYRLDATKSTKSVPWVIFKSPKPVVAAFLRGLFETDGGLEQNGRTISFSTASRKLVEEIQLLLLNFGITSSIYEKKNKNYSDRFYYYLRIIGYESRRIFAQEIRFITDRKNRDLDRGSDFGRDASNVIPNQYNRLRKILESVPRGYTQKKGDDARTRITRLISSSADSKRRSAISYDSARRLVELGRQVGADTLALEELDSICKTNYFWDPVISIENGKGEVADLFVPDGNEYVAQGMTNHNSSAERVYRAINPSLKQFTPKDKKNKHVPIGPTDGRMILISSPDAKDGFFYRQYMQAMSGDKAAANTLVIQAPTWEVNPTLAKEDYEIEFAKAPKSFMTEYGAEFSDRVRGFIDPGDLKDCIIPELRPKARSLPREPHWAGVDFAISGDGTAIVLTHIINGRIEVAYHEYWLPGRPWREVNPHLETPMVPYALTLQNVKRLDFDEVAEWFRVVNNRFYIIKGIFDQYAGPVFEQVLQKRNLHQFEMHTFFQSETSQMWNTFQMLMLKKQIGFYDWPLPADMNGAETSASTRHSPLIAELLELQVTQVGKNLIDVEAPHIQGKHDDQSDALARSIWLAMDYVRAHPNVLDIGITQKFNPHSPIRPVGLHQYQRARLRMGGGTPKERRVPRAMRRV